MRPHSPLRHALAPLLLLALAGCNDQGAGSGSAICVADDHCRGQRRCVAGACVPTDDLPDADTPDADTSDDPPDADLPDAAPPVEPDFPACQEPEGRYLTFSVNAVAGVSPGRLTALLAEGLPGTAHVVPQPGAAAIVEVAFEGDAVFAITPDVGPAVLEDFDGVYLEGEGPVEVRAGFFDPGVYTLEIRRQGALMLAYCLSDAHDGVCQGEGWSIRASDLAPCDGIEHPSCGLALPSALALTSEAGLSQGLYPGQLVHLPTPSGTLITHWAVDATTSASPACEGFSALIARRP